MTLPHEPADRVEQHNTVGPTQGIRRRIISASIALVVGPMLLTTVACSGKETSAAQGSEASSAAAGGLTSSAAESSAATPSKPATSAHGGTSGSDEGASGNGAAGGQHRGGSEAPSTARVAARTYAAAVNAKNANKMVSMICDLTKVEKYTYVKYFEKQFSKADAKLTLAGPTKMTGRFAVTRAHSKASAGGKSKSQDIVISMQKKGGRWCVPSRG